MPPSEGVLLLAVCLFVEIFVFLQYSTTLCAKWWAIMSLKVLIRARWLPDVHVNIKPYGALTIWALRNNTAAAAIGDKNPNMIGSLDTNFVCFLKKMHSNSFSPILSKQSNTNNLAHSLTDLDFFCDCVHNTNCIVHTILNFLLLKIRTRAKKPFVVSAQQKGSLNIVRQGCSFTN